MTREELLAALHAEFVRLNAEHFGGSLQLPQIVVSARKTYGGYYQPKTHKIVVSYQAYQEYGWPETVNTFRHEVAHIVHPNHSRAFWAQAMALGATQRHASPPLAPRREPGYHYACPGCGQRLARHRPLQRAMSCGRCAKAYNPVYKFILLVGRGNSKEPIGGSKGV